jgi:tRNA(Arg) A34 adenosine deaminase TadA
MQPQTVSLTMPDWVNDEIARLPTHLPELDRRMEAVIRFSRLNFERGTGGPFAAGVFEEESGKLVVMGVNRVMPNNVSSAHAEVMALSLAQQKLGVYDLGGPSLPKHQLVVNWRPCAMCYGAVIWAGVRSLVIAGDGPECEQITGFDEGPMRDDWADQLRVRGVEVTVGVLNAQAIEVFDAFRASGSVVYNARQGD